MKPAVDTIAPTNGCYWMLQSSMLLEGNRSRLEAELRQQLSAKAKPAKGALERLRKSLSKLDRDIGTAADRMLTAPNDLVENFSCVKTTDNA